MTGDLPYSRPEATAARLGDLAPDRHRFIDKHVLLTGEREVLTTENGRECLLSSLRLLVRTCSNVAVFLPVGCGDELQAESHAVAAKVAFRTPVDVLSDHPALARYDAILNVGTRAHPDLPWTVINSHGWVARVSSGARHLSSACGQGNPIAALAAASLGVADVFKRLIRLKETRGRLVDGLSFSLYSYRCGENDPGPSLPDQLVLDLLIVGAGAIGNGVVYLLGQLPIAGRAAIVDGQKFELENLGTCLLIGPSDVGTEKAMFAANILRTGLNAKGLAEDFTVFTARVGPVGAWRPIVVNALDNIDARHAVQALWPDLIVDGAIGDFGCQASRHPWGEDTACLMCLFRHPRGEPANLVASRASGLQTTRVIGDTEVVTEEDVRQAPPDKQEWLRTRLGRPICSVIQEAIAQHLSAEAQRVGFQPSVPFVACVSASMVVAELVKFLAGWPTPLEPRFQLDVLRGPAFGQLLPQARRSDCLCTTRARNIEKVRRARRAGSTVDQGDL
jgi:molybdopterin/thiamine biosynthesis adenylyltransferase